jgi:hypothetical protein
VFAFNNRWRFQHDQDSTAARVFPDEWPRAKVRQKRHTSLAMCDYLGMVLYVFICLFGEKHVVTQKIQDLHNRQAVIPPTIASCN